MEIKITLRISLIRKIAEEKLIFRTVGDAGENVDKLMMFRNTRIKIELYKTS